MIYFNLMEMNHMCGNGGRCLVSYALQLDIDLKTNSLAIDEFINLKLLITELLK